MATHLLDADGDVNAGDWCCAVGNNVGLGVDSSGDREVGNAVGNSVRERARCDGAGQLIAQVQRLGENRDAVERSCQGSRGRLNGLREGTADGHVEVAARLDVVWGNGILQVLENRVGGRADGDHRHTRPSEGNGGDERKNNELHEMAIFFVMMRKNKEDQYHRFNMSSCIIR